MRSLEELKTISFPSTGFCTVIYERSSHFDSPSRSGRTWKRHDESAKKLPRKEQDSRDEFFAKRVLNSCGFLHAVNFILGVRRNFPAKISVRRLKLDLVDGTGIERKRERAEEVKYHKVFLSINTLSCIYKIVYVDDKILSIEKIYKFETLVNFACCISLVTEIRKNYEKLTSFFIQSKNWGV